MKKIILTTFACVSFASICFPQGAVILNTTSPLVTTNNGVVSGAASGSSTYYYAVLDMTQSQYAGLNPSQQSSLTNLYSSSILPLWTYSGVNGNNVSLHPGGIAGNATASGNTASNWAEPTVNQTYNTASSYDYYVIVGWSANEGTSWLTVSNELATSSMVSGPGSWFGVSMLAYNYAGVPGAGSQPAAVNLWGTSTTGLAGSGGVTGLVLTPVTAVPEPSTIALAALGGASLLLFRRRK